MATAEKKIERPKFEGEVELERAQFFEPKTSLSPNEPDPRMNSLKPASSQEQLSDFLKT